MIIYLRRYESTSDGAFGELIVGNNIYQTVEKPWLNNEPFESCIPVGTYDLKKFKRPNGDNVYMLLNDRDGVTPFKEPHTKRYTILIHAGNSEKDVVGCIAPGMYRKGDYVTDSRKACGEIFDQLDRHENNKIYIEFKAR